MVSHRVPLLSGAVSQADLRAWEKEGLYAVQPAPRAGFYGKRLEIFWDVENCPFNAKWPDDGEGKTPHGHYDMLYQVMAANHGVASKDYFLHVYVSQYTLSRMKPKTSMNATQMYGKYVAVESPKGKQMNVDGKTIILKDESHGVDNIMKNGIERFGDHASEGDVLVIISGDKDYISRVKTVWHERGVQVLHISTRKGHAPEWSDAYENGLVTWHCFWEDFLEAHKTNQAIRMAPKEQAKAVRDQVRMSVLNQQKLGNLGIVLLFDATKSMEDAVTAVKDHIDRTLLTEIIVRYPSLRDRIRYAVVCYRDIPADASDSEEYPHFDLLTIDPSLPLEKRPHFTSNVDDVRSFLSNLKVGGGVDSPEDVAGALLAVSNLNFPEDSYNMVIHIFDDPGHGPAFNDTYVGRDKYGKPKDRFFDKFPEGRKDPVVEATEALTRLKQECNVIKYMMMTINHQARPRPSTAKTVETIKKISAGIPLGQRLRAKVDSSHLHSWAEETDIGFDCSALVSSMVKNITRTAANVSASSRVMSRMSNSAAWEDKDTRPAGLLFKGNENPNLLKGVASRVRLMELYNARQYERRGKAITVKDKGPVYDSWYFGAGRPALERLMENFAKCELQEVEVKMLAEPDDLFELIDRVDENRPLDPMRPSNPKQQYRVFEQEILDKGAERVCVLAQEHGNERKLHVLKQFKHKGDGAQAFDRYNRVLTSHTIASYLAKEFSALLKESTSIDLTLEYVDSCIVSFVPSGQADDVNYRFQERFIAGKFTKFTTNEGGCADTEEMLPIVATFAHWTYVATEGRVMVTDLQGWYDADAKRVLLTDPCVVCPQMGLTNDGFTNTGWNGMHDFFASHECEDTCKALELDKKKPVFEALNELRRHMEETMRGKQVRLPAYISSTSGSGTAAEQHTQVDIQEQLIAAEKFADSLDMIPEVDDSGASSDDQSSDITVKVPEEDICRFFNRPGGCRRGGSCKFVHVSGPSFPSRPGSSGVSLFPRALGDSPAKRGGRSQWGGRASGPPAVPAPPVPDKVPTAAPAAQKLTFEEWQKAFQGPAQHHGTQDWTAGDNSEEEKRQKTFQGIINEIAPNNVECLTNKIIEEVKITDERTLIRLIDTIYDKALMNKQFSELCARMCKAISTHPHTPTFSYPEGGRDIDVRRLLLNKCQEEFENRMDSFLIPLGGKSTHSEERAASRTVADKEPAARQRMLGNIQFIGFLYKNQLLTERILHSCIAALLREEESPRPEDVECLCKLMSIVGGELDNTNQTELKAAMKVYFTRLQKLHKNTKLDSRTRFMIQDVLDLRDTKWVPRIIDEGPKDIEGHASNTGTRPQQPNARYSRASCAVSESDDDEDDSN